MLETLFRRLRELRDLSATSNELGVRPALPFASLNLVAESLAQPAWI